MAVGPAPMELMMRLRPDSPIDVTVQNAAETLQAMVLHELRTKKRTELPSPIRAAAQGTQGKPGDVSWEDAVAREAVAAMAEQFRRFLGGTAAYYADTRLNVDGLDKIEDPGLRRFLARTLDVMAKVRSGGRIELNTLPARNRLLREAVAVNNRWSRAGWSDRVVAGQYRLEGPTTPEDLGQLARKTFAEHFGSGFAQAIPMASGGQLVVTRRQSRELEPTLIPPGLAETTELERLLEALGTLDDVSHGTAIFTARRHDEADGRAFRVTVFANRELGRYLAILTG